MIIPKTQLPELGDFNVNSVYNYLNNTDTKTIIKFVNHKISDAEFKKAIFYYSWIFRKEKKFLKCFNHPKLSPAIVIDYIYNCFGRFISKGEEPEIAMSLSCEMLSSETCKRILKERIFFAADINLALTFISKLNEADFNEFSKENDLSDFLETVFKELDQSQIKNYFTNNPVIYNYIIQVSKYNKDPEFYSKFMKKYQKDIQIIEQVISITNQAKKLFGEVSPNAPSVKKERMDLVLRELRKSENPIEILAILSAKGFFADDTETKTLEYLLQLPSS